MQRSNSRRDLPASPLPSNWENVGQDDAPGYEKLRSLGNSTLLGSAQAIKHQRWNPDDGERATRFARWFLKELRLTGSISNLQRILHQAEAEARGVSSLRVPQDASSKPNQYDAYFSVNRVDDDTALTWCVLTNVSAFLRVLTHATSSSTALDGDGIAVLVSSLILILEGTIASATPIQKDSKNENV